MKYLAHNEIKEKSIIIIDLLDGSSILYYVDQKRKGEISGATMLLGHKLSDLLQNPSLYPCSVIGGTDRYYIANEETNGSDTRVKGYRRLEAKETNDCMAKIKSARHLAALFKVLSLG